MAAGALVLCDPEERVDLGLDFSPIWPEVFFSWRSDLDRPEVDFRKSSPYSHRATYPTQESLSRMLGVSLELIQRWESDGVTPPWTALLREHWEHGDPVSPVDASVGELERVLEIVGGVAAFVAQVPVSERCVYKWKAGGVSGRYGWGRLIKNLAIDFGVADG